MADYADDELDLGPRPAPPLTLSDLERVLNSPDLLPPGAEAAALGISDYRYTAPELGRTLRVTLDRDFFDAHSESVEFWSPGSPAFPLSPPRAQ